MDRDIGIRSGISLRQILLEAQGAFAMPTVAFI